jgi:S1-C subfamily serine protease
LPSFAVSVQEALLLVPAVALVSAGQGKRDGEWPGPITVSPKPFIEVGTGWFVVGRGYLITNAHVIDPAYMLPWSSAKLRAVDQTSAEVGPHGQHVVLRDALALPVLLQNGSTQRGGLEHVQTVR